MLFIIIYNNSHEIIIFLLFVTLELPFLKQVLILFQVLKLLLLQLLLLFLLLLRLKLLLLVFLIFLDPLILQFL